MKSNKDQTSYAEVNTDEGYEAQGYGNNSKSSWTPFFRQLLFSSTIWTLYFLYGLHIGAPTVLIAQLRRESKSPSDIDDEMASWITSIVTFGALPWVFLLPMISQFMGRKKTFIFIYLSCFVGFLVLYLCKNLTQLLIGEIVLGIVLGCLHAIGPLTINEYVSPKYRGIFMTIKSASSYWGMWVSNVIGTFMDWKNIVILAFMCNIYTITVLIWPESPYWLAQNGKVIECMKSHRWLKGNSMEAEKELENIIRSFKCQEQSNVKSIFSKEYLFTLYKTLSCKAFYKPVSIASLIVLQYHLSGKLVCSMYAIELLKKITKDESTAYRGMLILDGITVFSVYCGCVLSQFFKRRTYLLSSSLFAIIFLYILSLYLYLTRESFIPENNIITISLLGFYSVAVSGGPMILLTSVCGELIPIRYQRSAAIIVGAVAATVMIITIKSSLFLFKTLTLAGTFLCFAILSSIITILLYLYLPETKDRTPLEIENNFVRTSSSNETGKNNGLMNRYN
ncbi:facilitated trehalose transporter Tret1-like [Maniola jurtina]|uniref:facilitated trehalose transporter Tret1-like n=1 Tax=Maniola jurtina TaxID=191418 RepID=UPI001E68C9A4|nr:facilitated trehalose transporter Tret1-like [Maniola jurtina]